MLSLFIYIRMSVFVLNTLQYWQNMFSKLHNNKQHHRKYDNNRTQDQHFSNSLYLSVTPSKSHSLKLYTQSHHLQ